MLLNITWLESTGYKHKTCTQVNPRLRGRYHAFTWISYSVPCYAVPLHKVHNLFFNLANCQKIHSLFLPAAEEPHIPLEGDLTDWYTHLYTPEPSGHFLINCRMLCQRQHSLDTSTLPLRCSTCAKCPVQCLTYFIVMLLPILQLLLHLPHGKL